jgi:hypothetical protein
MVIEPTRRISFLPAKPIPLLGETAEAGLPVGSVFLAVAPIACIVDDKVAAAQMVTQVVLHRWASIVRKRLSYPNQGNPLLIVQHMQDLVLVFRVALDLVAVLKHAVDVNHDLAVVIRGSHQLFHALAAAVVEVKGLQGRLGTPPWCDLKHHLWMIRISPTVSHCPPTPPESACETH